MYLVCDYGMFPRGEAFGIPSETAYFGFGMAIYKVREGGNMQQLAIGREAFQCKAISDTIDIVHFMS